MLRIDPETGEPAIERLALLDDAGRIVDAAGAEAQLHGGIAQGLGEALMEPALDALGPGAARELDMPLAAEKLWRAINQRSGR